LARACPSIGGIASSAETKVGGHLGRLRLEQLEPDRLNPRLPQYVQAEGRSPEELHEYVATAYDAIAIAESIVRHGYFESEPLIALPARAAYPDEKRKGAAAERYVVVEGNRRLAALKALSDLEFRSRLKGRRWAALPDEVDLPDDYPVLVAGDRQQIAPILGFRHITGISPWEPYPQANYIADLVDNHDRSFSDVARLLNRGETEIKSFYRNYWIGKQAREEFELPDADRILDNFGVFTRAMQNPAIRAFISAPDPAAVTADFWPLPESEKSALAQLVTWLFGKPRRPGDRDTKRPRPGQVLLDSRHVTRLGAVLSNERGLASLKKGSSLADAEEAIRDPSAQVVSALRAAAKVIDSTLNEQAKDARPALKRALSAVNDAIAALQRDASNGT
jgi:hypothetical protein